MTIADMYERVHLFVEHTVGEQPLTGELNPLIEYPIQYPVHNENVGVHVKEIVEEMENDGVDVEVDNEGVAVDMENEGIAVEMENEGGDGNEGFENEEGVYVEDDKLDCGGNFEKEVVTNEGPTVGVESSNVVDERVTVGGESSNVEPTVLEEGINNAPTDLNMGVNDFGPPIYEHEEFRDEYVDENWSKGDGYESEVNALGVHFGDPE